MKKGRPQAPFLWSDDQAGHLVYGHARNASQGGGHHNRKGGEPRPIARDAPGSIACGLSGLPLLAICPIGHRRTAPFRLLKTSEDDRTPLYGRPFKCRDCGSREVAALYAIETQAELDELRQVPLAPRPALPHSTHRPPNTDADLL
jgi:hypothetical protein